VKRTKGSRISWEADFPMREKVEDYAGKMRVFTIDCHEGGLGFTVRAVEDGKEVTGYHYAAYSETSPYSALGRVRQKMRRGLATRHLSGRPSRYSMLHDKLTGRIGSDGEGSVVLIVDGVPLDMNNLSSILATHEGCCFELRIVDALE
jgi:hypothetical protein